MAEMLIQSESLTHIADQIRVLSGTKDAMGLDAMATHISEANTNVSTEAGLIAQIQTALQDKASATGEDVTSETNAYTTKLATLETAITALETELQGKASGGSGSTVSVIVDNRSFDTVYFYDANKQVQAVESGTQSGVRPINGVLWLSASGMTPSIPQGDFLIKYIGSSFYICIFLSDGKLVCHPIDT